MVIPCKLVEANVAVTLAANVFFVNETVFLMTVLRNIRFIMTEHVPVQMAKSLCKHLERVLLVYGQAGFRIRTISMDGEFEKVKNLIPIEECNTTAAKEHVSEAERTIRTVKEWTRGLIVTLPFNHILQQMKIEFIYFAVLWLNTFPVRTGILAIYSPRELLVRWHLDYKKHCRVLPGTYCEVHYELVPSNSMTPCTHKAIALGRTGNLQGSVKFCCLNTRQVLKRRSFTPMPMPTRIIKMGGHDWGAQGGDFRFVNRNKEPYEWMDEVPEDNPYFQGLLEDKEEAAVYLDVVAELPGVTLEDNMDNSVAVVEDYKPNFRDLAAIALDNVGIDPQECLRAAQAAAAGEAAVPETGGPAIIDAEEDEIIYELTFDLPDVGIQQNNKGIDGAGAIPMDTDEVALPPAETADKPWHYSTQSHRSAIGHQPYNKYLTPRMTFLQLGEA